MKQQLAQVWLLPLLIFAMMSCFTLTSCGGDDDKHKEEDEPEIVTPNKYALLLKGEWSRNENRNPYYRLVFLDGGTGYDKVMSGNSYVVDETFKWSVSGSTLTITWEDSEKEHFTIVDVNATELILKDISDPERYIYFTRVN